MIPGTINPYGSLSVSESAKLMGTSEEVVLRGYEHEEDLKRLEQENIRRSKMSASARAAEDEYKAQNYKNRMDVDSILKSSPKYNQRQSFFTNSIELQYL